MSTANRKGRCPDSWEFWIDVGGTFTDCIARRPDGAIVTHKLLSSGAYKGEVKPGSTRFCIRDPQRCRDPDGYFQGYHLTLLRPATGSGRAELVEARHATGCGGEEAVQVLDEDVPVARFARDGGELELSRPLVVQPKPGMLYELRSDEPAPVAGIRWLMGNRLDQPIGPARMRLGTTRGTNALLERQGTRTALVTTVGFRDVLRIAYQNRPRLFELEIRKPVDLYQEVVELNERVDKDGRVVEPLAESEVGEKLSILRQRGIDAVAVCLLNAYRNGEHERMVERVALQLGFEQVSLSSRLSPLPKMVSRGDTTVVDAYLTPVIREYVAGLAARAPEASLKLMTSAGALTDASRFVGKDSIFSGPAGGVVGAAYVARQAGLAKVIGFDMGGTSTDVSRFDGEYERRYEMELNDPESGTGVRIVAPMLSIETVAAGGGSVCWFDGQKPVVGPRSAGADPGPACYGRGGPLCVTDVNLYLGKIVPRHFPFPLDGEAVGARLDELIDEIAEATGRRYAREELAAGFTAIANANMVAPIKKISIARGYDAREYALVSFGGAGAQHACAIARELGIRKVLSSPYAGVLSALGIGIADVTKFAERAIGRPYGDFVRPSASPEPSGLEAVFREMYQRLRQQVSSEGIPEARVKPPRRLLEMRYVGQESRITVPCPADGDYAREFERLHRQLYGFAFPGRPVEVYAARMELVGETEKPPRVRRPPQPRRPEPDQHTQVYFDGAYCDAAVYLRDALRPGDQIDGLAIIIEPTATIVVEPGWSAEVTSENNVLLTDGAGERGWAGAPATQGIDDLDRPDPVQLELFNNHFASIAEQMGAVLQKTAVSTNVKERLDFSCAIFSAAGDLVVNAPHIPVHLGGMSECIKQLIEDVPDMWPGEVYLTNDPFRGGSHLPDVTAVTPVFAPGEPGSQEVPSILFFTASRAHHAEIGGTTPGSVPPFARTLAEEGVILRHLRLVHKERSSEEELRRILASGPFPSRAVEENVADINAQAAANQAGANLLLSMIERYGLATVQAYMEHIQRAAESKMRSALLKIPPGEHRFTDYLDDGSPISVTITIQHTERDGRRQGEAVVDFRGTGPVHPGNLNANRAIVSSAVIYCFRCLIDEPIPLNAGLLMPIEIRLPDDCLLNPAGGSDPAMLPAMGGGNVETSQRIVDSIFGALGVAAASQGTMNNVVFGRSAVDGRSAFGYYETIGGGAGAGPTFDGADAVHTHMTNTRLTDPEVLESRYPVRVRRFEIRRGSGGAGRHHGGDGIVREIEFLEPAEVSLVTSRRTMQPYGMAGGEPGAAGHNLLRRRGETEFEELPGITLIQVDAGDVLRIETPGGGGYGVPEPRQRE